jgi:hypothetical protein
MSQLVNPEKLELIHPPIKTDNLDNEDNCLKKFYKLANRVASIFFISVEFIVGVLIYVVLFISVWKMFICPDSLYINNFQNVIIFINTYWIGFLFLIPLIFFRLIILKITNLKEVKGIVNFREGALLYKIGEYSGE